MVASRQGTTRRRDDETTKIVGGGFGIRYYFSKSVGLSVTGFAERLSMQFLVLTHL
jgi:hypothetical protein